MINKTIISWIIFSYLSLNTIAQSLSVSPSQLSFGNVYENSPDSLQIIITNNTGRDLTVTNIRFYTTYGVPAFSTTSNSMWIMNTASSTIWIKFSPRHNIFHNTEMVIENDGLRGNVCVDLRGQGKYSNTYYSLTENIAEENLKTILGIITGNGFTSLGYNLARDEMFMSIDNKKLNGQGATQNTLECVYTGRQAVGYTSRTDCQTNHQFNTEHNFPQSFFSSAEPMRSDLHHLFPTDDNANNKRADDPFDIVTNPTWTVGNSKSDGNTFEPRDQQKGAAARSLFYFVLRYQDYNNFVAPQESILRTWCQNFQTTPEELTRNNNIYSVQQNRNPFIDYPVFLERINSVTSNSVAPFISSLDLTEDTIIFGTIPVSTAVTYNYTIVNNGNVPVNVSNLALTNSALSFTSNANDTTLAAGDGLNIKITCNSANTDSIRAFLTYNTNASGYSSVTVPVFVNDNIYNTITEINSSFSIQPNPATDYITVTTTGNAFQWTLSDITGKFISKGSDSEIAVQHLQRGMYILNINGSTYRKIILH